MRLFLNGLAASTSSGLTYIRNVLPELSRSPGVHTTIAVSRLLQNELQDLPNVSFVPVREAGWSGTRFLMEQTALARLVRLSKSDVLLSAGNFALRNSPVPQILLSGNSLYTSSDFLRDLRRRRAYGLWLDTRIKGFFARQSIRWADRTIAPSCTFAKELTHWAGKDVLPIYHGFDAATFFADEGSLAQDAQDKLNSGRGTWRLLVVSHYNYFRNFETVFLAIALLRARLGHQRLKLFLTCRLGREHDQSSFDSSPAASLVKDLGIADEVVELGPIPYRGLHRVYRACDAYVSASCAETFAHPLVEAMASGLPILASDIPVHREICGDGALYFSKFSPEHLADQAARVYSDEPLRKRMSAAGLARSRDFSWRKHVAEILGVARELCR